jgi:hypothetical protein
MRILFLRVATVVLAVLAIGITALVAMALRFASPWQWIHAEPGLSDLPPFSAFHIWLDRLEAPLQGANVAIIFGMAGVAVVLWQPRLGATLFALAVLILCGSGLQSPALLRAMAADPQLFAACAASPLLFLSVAALALVLPPGATRELLDMLDALAGVLSLPAFGALAFVVVTIPQYGFITGDELGPLTLMALVFSGTVLGWLAVRWFSFRGS